MNAPSFDAYLDAQTARHYAAGPSGVVQMTLQRRAVGPAAADSSEPWLWLEVDVQADDGGAYVCGVLEAGDEAGDLPRGRAPWLESLCELTSAEQDEAAQRVADALSEESDR